LLRELALAHPVLLEYVNFNVSRWTSFRGAGQGS